MSLSTHVLDTANGVPAEGMKIEFWHIALDHKRILLCEVKTNSDGRVDTPLLSKENTKNEEYELVFYVADYFRAKGIRLPEPPFLDKVPIRFGIAESSEHYHVPLLFTPWSYSTYRGS